MSMRDVSDIKGMVQRLEERINVLTRRVESLKRGSEVTVLAGTTVSVRTEQPSPATKPKPRRKPKPKSATKPGPSGA